jgi:predicted nucleotidyltransferase
MFDTHLLDAAARKRSERLEAERRAVLESVIAVLVSEARSLGVREAYVVGSLAKEGEWAEGSDVDVAVAGGDPLEVMRVVEQAAGRAVDVIDLERHPEPSSTICMARANSSSN